MKPPRISSIETSSKIIESRVREEMRDLLGCDIDSDPMVVEAQARQSARETTFVYLKDFGLADFAANYLKLDESESNRLLYLLPTRAEMEPDMVDVTRKQKGADVPGNSREIKTYIRPRFFNRFHQMIEAAGSNCEPAPFDDRYLAVEAGYCFLYGNSAVSSLINDLQLQAGNTGRSGVLNQILETGLRTYVGDPNSYRTMRNDELDVYRFSAVPVRAAARFALEHVAQQLVRAERTSPDNAEQLFEHMIENRYQAAYHARVGGVDVSGADIGLAKPFDDKECSALLEGLGLLFRDTYKLHSV